MKKYLIILLSLVTVFGYSQTKIDPTLSPTTARINEAIQGSITASGTDTYTGTLTGLTTVTGKAFNVTFTNANTGSATFNLNASGAVTIRKFEGGTLVNLVAGDISAGETKRIRYNGTYLVIESGGAGGGGITALTGDISASGSGSVIATINPNVIIDAYVNPLASIAGTKIANVASGGISSTNVQDAINELGTEKADTSYIMKRSGWSNLSSNILTYGHGFREDHVVGNFRVSADDSVALFAPNTIHLENSAGSMRLVSDDFRAQTTTDDTYFSNISGAEMGSSSGSNVSFLRSLSGNIDIQSFSSATSTTNRLFNTGAVLFLRSSTSANATQLRQTPTTGISLETSVAGTGSFTARLGITAAGLVTWTLGSDASGDMWYRNSSGNMTRISAGAQNTVLTMGASSVPSWSQIILSGTYTPTLTNVANLDGSTAYLCTYMRVGSTVTVSGRVDIDPTTTLTSTQLGINLPVPSALTTSDQAGGTAQATAIAGQGAAIRSDATNDRAELIYTTTDVTNQPMYFTFTYQIL